LTDTNAPPCKLQTLPSGESAAAFIEGKPGAWLGVVGHTALRATLIAGGLYAAGLRKRVIPGALAASAAIELFVLSWVALKRAEFERAD